MSNRFPSFHDGYLTSIALTQGGTTLGLRTQDGTRFDLQLTGVEALLASKRAMSFFTLDVVNGNAPSCTNID